MPTVTFGITCCRRDDHLLGRCLASVKNQTVKPDRIIVLSSGYNYIDQKIQNWDNLYLNKDGLSAGEARNRILSMCDTDILSFCDVDDEIHPQKCEIVKHIFNTMNIDMLIHAYNKGRQDFKNIDIKKITLHKITKKAKYSSTSLECPIEDNMCHGPISIKIDTIKKNNLWYKNSSMGEDGLFCRSVLTKVSGASIMYCPERLINYIK